MNLITQLLLNAALGAANYKHGGFAFLLVYALLELVILVIETLAYSRAFRRLCPERPAGRLGIALYTLAANAASLGMGLFIAFQFPGVFYHHFY